MVEIDLNKSAWDSDPFHEGTVGRGSNISKVESWRKGFKYSLETLLFSFWLSFFLNKTFFFHLESFQMCCLILMIFVLKH